MWIILLRDQSILREEFYLRLKSMARIFRENRLVTSRIWFTLTSATKKWGEIQLEYNSQTKYSK